MYTITAAGQDGNLTEAGLQSACLIPGTLHRQLLALVLMQLNRISATPKREYSSGCLVPGTLQLNQKYLHIPYVSS